MRAAPAAIAPPGALEISEFLLYSSNALESIPYVNTLSSLRPSLKLQTVDDKEVTKVDGAIWTTYRGNVQLDCCVLESHWLGAKRSTQNETMKLWNSSMDLRLKHISSIVNSESSVSSTSIPSINIGDGGKYQKELDTAVIAVQAASFMSRSLQTSLLKNLSSVTKEDKSPVTIADFACQAIIIDALSRAFPEDEFIAEENSEVLKADPIVRDAVLSAVTSVTGNIWTDDKLFSVVDKGAFDGKTNRVWVLDPVDGTKGFMRGENYCIALSLLVDGVPVLSTLGCPNLVLKEVLQSSTLDAHTTIPKIPPAISIDLPSSPSSSSSSLTSYPSNSGAIFFAITGRGAFARSLSMPFGAAIEVTVNPTDMKSEITLCESVEAGHGNRTISKSLHKTLGLRSDYVRLDGQCKYCVVGAGGASGNLRLPPLGYREKIWDQAPGTHFIIEAGGKVTDLNGNELNFSEGRLMSEKVRGIVASNGAIHDLLLNNIKKIRGVDADKEDISRTCLDLN